MMDFFLTLFSKYKCLIHTAFGHEGYIRVVNKLSAHGIRFRTRIHSHAVRHLGGDMGMLPQEQDHKQYDVYVAKEDEHQAHLAIHSR
ncbi:hypothetical protein [Brevibacillus brevis]|uniref:hypothetical protein n=1 Tax=Brevibacillus brevis TaxID=1393 RepID=UPI001F5BF82F|nr:hypothetical protein [Brevibacillus brevis]